MDKKTCDYCGESYRREYWVRPSKWKLRRFCSPSCSSKSAGFSRHLLLSAECWDLLSETPAGDDATLEAIERRAILGRLIQADSIDEAAESLGISPRKIQLRLAEWRCAR